MPYLPKASKIRQKAGLLTCSLHAAFPPMAVAIKKARSIKELTATGIVSDFHRCSLFILGDNSLLKHLYPSQNYQIYADSKVNQDK